ncbi:3-deoxy-D-manno-octulosonic acid transferase [Pseudoleptotrichia goodfellowii]|uniref:3-deoxy-D-manno-octulosonic acid transferase n=1 Tax=Pseudoleptotrichia goodfellowii TaxID=157692 RepID=UPI000587A55B|nr:glycosyltransferase N-terminal domain-containing protein [Pseudoleptotrichia goodfellowii]
MIIYNILRFILYIPIFIISLFNKKTREFFKKRLFQDPENRNFLEKEEKAVFIHMSSVGEFNLSKELIEKLLEKKEKIIISVMTDTGKEAVTKAYGNNKNIKIIFFPLDDYFMLRKVYKNFSVKKTVIIETEIWPNLYQTAEKYSELYIINGRLTEKNMKTYRKIKPLIKKTLNKVKKIMIQSEEDKERYLDLGVKKEKIYVFKNLKYSIKYEILSEKEKKELLDNYTINGRKIIVCGSTRPGEEKIWIEVFKEININSVYQLIIVPRHLDRISEIADEIKQTFGEENFSLLSENKKNDIILVDKMGMLRDFYQLADFVFVGGTLVNIGGHSILEPLYYGKMPIIGEYYQNIEEIVKEAKKMKFIKIVKNKNEITEYLKKSEIIDTSDFFKKNDEIDKILKELYGD